MSTQPVIVERIGQGDQAILELLNNYPYLMTEDMEAELNRGYRALNRRLKELTERGYLERHGTYSDAKFLGYVYCLRSAGLQLARSRHFSTDKAYLNPEKSVRMIPHEMEITKFHRALAHIDGIELTHWEQRKTVLLDHVNDRKERLSINPDGFFGLSKAGSEDVDYFYLEVEKSRPKWSDGESALMRKVRAFSEYRRQELFKGHWATRGLPVADFRLIFVMRTKEKATNFLERASHEFPSRMLWITDEESYRAGITNFIFRTPKDYLEKAHGFLD